MPLDNAILGSLVTALSGLCGIGCQKCKMRYGTDAQGRCKERRCAFTQASLVDDDPLELRVVEANGVELLYVGRKREEAPQQEEESPKACCM